MHTLLLWWRAYRIYSARAKTARVQHWRVWLVVQARIQRKLWSWYLSVVGRRRACDLLALGPAHLERKHSSCLPKRQSCLQWRGDQENYVPNLYRGHAATVRCRTQRKESEHAVSGQWQDHKAVGRPHFGVDSRAALHVLRERPEVHDQVGHCRLGHRSDWPLRPRVQRIFNLLTPVFGP